LHALEHDYIPRMKATPTAETTTSGRLTTVLSYGAILLLGYLVFLIAEPFLVPLAWSAVLAIFFYPLHERISRAMAPSRAAAISTLGVTLLLIVPALAVLVLTAREALEATARLQSVLAVHGQGPMQPLAMRIENWVLMKMPESWRTINIAQPLQEAAGKVASFIGSAFAGLLRNTVSFFVDLFILIFALFFMFRDGDGIVRGVRHLLPFDEEIQTDMLDESKDLIFASVAVGLLIAAIQGVLGGISFALVGISAPVFWGVLIAFFSLVPVVGSALIWGPACIWLLLNGNWAKALIVVGICGGVSTVADNIVRPLLLRNRTRLNELLLFIGVLGGIETFGLLGLVVGPTIVAAAMGVFRVYMDHRDQLAAQTR
jgi:predicted PurR-regulated permease PerM